MAPAYVADAVGASGWDLAVSGHCCVVHGTLHVLGWDS